MDTETVKNGKIGVIPQSTVPTQLEDYMSSCGTLSAMSPDRSVGRSAHQNNSLGSLRHSQMPHS